MNEPYDSVYKHSIEKGFDPVFANLVATSISNLSGEYQHSQRARYVYTFTYPRFISRPFSPVQLYRFTSALRKDSFNPSDGVIYALTGMFPDGFETLKSRGELSDEQIKDYYDKVNSLSQMVRSGQELTTLRLLEVGEYYGILQGRVLMPLKEQEKPLPAPHMISVPMGGMPKFRRKRRIV